MSDAPRLRILLIGASGELGRAIVEELGGRHDIVSAGSSNLAARARGWRAPSVLRQR